MSNEWKKLGCIFCPSENSEWRWSHAYTPTPILLNNDIIRVFLAFLDKGKVGRLGYIDVDSKDPRKVISVSETPCLDIGAPGCFDDSGVTPISIVTYEDTFRLYYVGWELSDKVRYKLFTGLAISNDQGLSFDRYIKTPILERNDQELIVRTAANVLKIGDSWRMWYIGGSETINVDGKQVPTYNMRTLESPDGLTWSGTGDIILDPEGLDEYGFGRPFVCSKEDGTYEMWYSIRSKSQGYHIGYAVSKDGVEWERQDHLAGIQKSKAGWDSEMMAFGAVCDTSYGRYLFYNGNNYGETGVGVAILQE